METKQREVNENNNASIQFCNFKVVYIIWRELQFITCEFSSCFSSSLFSRICCYDPFDFSTFTRILSTLFFFNCNSVRTSDCIFCKTFLNCAVYPLFSFFVGCFITIYLFSQEILVFLFFFLKKNLFKEWMKKFVALLT